MNSFAISLVFTVMATTMAFSNSAFYGSWQETKSGTRLDILDGFKSGQCPVLIVESDDNVSIENWQEKNGVFEVIYGYETYVASIDQSGNLQLKDSYDDRKVFTSVLGNLSSSAINLKDEGASFVDKL